MTIPASASKRKRVFRVFQESAAENVLERKTRSVIMSSLRSSKRSAVARVGTLIVAMLATFTQYVEFLLKVLFYFL